MVPRLLAELLCTVLNLRGLKADVLKSQLETDIGKLCYNLHFLYFSSTVDHVAACNLQVSIDKNLNMQ